MATAGTSTMMPSGGRPGRRTTAGAASAATLFVQHRPHRLDPSSGVVIIGSITFQRPGRRPPAPQGPELDPEHLGVGEGETDAAHAEEEG